VATGRAHQVLVASCVCALLALALMTWQLFDPRVLPIIVAMSAGQILGTASFLAYLYVVVVDFRAHQRAEKESRKIETS
jgi:hypothetical protein